MINFYMTPGSCSTGIHILLEELDLVFSANLVNLMAGDQFTPEFIAINPKSTIPVLMLDDGTVLTTFQGIAWWLALNYPKSKLLPASIGEQSRALDTMGYIVNQIHGMGFTRIFTPEIYSLDETLSDDCRQKIKKQGEGIVTRGFELMADLLPAAGYFYGEQFTVVDAALFYVEFWSDKTGLNMPAKCITHYQTMKQRRAVRQVLAEEGYRN